jgi:PIN domain nuclease of toxin-antitoxin system
MKLLLDTHVFLWFITGDSRLPPPFKQAIGERENEAFLSVVSIWEAIIKQAIGRLPLPNDAGEYLSLQRVRHQLVSLPIDEECVIELRQLPPFHRDPFDRMLICQVRRHNLTLMTVDREFAQYSVNRFDV